MEPERPIEKLLRAAAKKRREQSGSPLELHPVNRRQLQEEVARRLRAPARDGFWNLARRLLRPPVIYAACGLMIVALGLMLFRNPSQDPRGIQLASAPAEAGRLNESGALTRESQDEAADAFISKSPVETDESRRRVTVIADQPALEDSRLDLVPAQAPGAAGSSATMQAQTEAVEQSRERHESNLSVVEPAFAGTNVFAATPGPIASAAIVGGSAGIPAPMDDADATPDFHQLGKFVSARTDSVPVLVSFEMERAGEEIRIVDQDGSVYRGRMEPPARTMQIQTRDDAVARTAVSTVTQTNLFLVTGTNRQLGRRITFNGTLVQIFPVTNAVTFRMSGDRTQPPASVAPARPSPPPPPTQRIRGRLMLEGERELPVEAETSAAP